MQVRVARVHAASAVNLQEALVKSSLLDLAPPNYSPQQSHLPHSPVGTVLKEGGVHELHAAAAAAAREDEQQQQQRHQQQQQYAQRWEVLKTPSSSGEQLKAS
jgi:hypothetical protein